MWRRPAARPAGAMREARSALAATTWRQCPRPILEAQPGWSSSARASSRSATEGSASASRPRHRAASTRGSGRPDRCAPAVPQLRFGGPMPGVPKRVRASRHTHSPDRGSVDRHGEVRIDEPGVNPRGKLRPHPVAEVGGGRNPFATVGVLAQHHRGPAVGSTPWPGQDAEGAADKAHGHASAVEGAVLAGEGRPRPSRAGWLWARPRAPSDGRRGRPGSARMRRARTTPPRPPSASTTVSMSWTFRPGRTTALVDPKGGKQDRPEKLEGDAGQLQGPGHRRRASAARATSAATGPPWRAVATRVPGRVGRHHPVPVGTKRAGRHRPVGESVRRRG